MTHTLPSFPVDTGTLNVIRDSLETGFIGNDVDGPVRVPGSFRLLDILAMFSGESSDDSSLLVFSRDDLIAALIDEILRLRAHDTEETCP